MPDTDWRRRIDAIAPAVGQSTADVRKAVLVEAISEAIGRLGGYEYVMETPVLFPTKERTFYSLIYATRSPKGVEATRSPKGVEVFRDCQHAALKAQDQVRANLQVAKRADLFGITDMFGGAITGNDYAGRWMAEQEAVALTAILDRVPISPSSTTYGDL